MRSYFNVKKSSKSNPLNIFDNSKFTKKQKKIGKLLEFPYIFNLKSTFPKINFYVQHELKLEIYFLKQFKLLKNDLCYKCKEFIMQQFYKKTLFKISF